MATYKKKPTTLITRRSAVQIRPPQPNTDFIGTPSHFLKRLNYSEIEFSKISIVSLDFLTFAVMYF